MRLVGVYMWGIHGIMHQDTWVWFYQVSHLKVLWPIEGESHNIANEEVIIEHEHARRSPNSLMIIKSCINMVDAGLHDGQTYEYVHNVLLDIRDEMFPTTTYMISKRRRQLRQSRAPSTVTEIIVFI